MVLNGIIFRLDDLFADPSLPLTLDSSSKRTICQQPHGPPMVSSIQCERRTYDNKVQSDFDQDMDDDGEDQNHAFMEKAARSAKA